jgi:hypothetical protein
MKHWGKEKCIGINMMDTSWYLDVQCKTTLQRKCSSLNWSPCIKKDTERTKLSDRCREQPFKIPQKDMLYRRQKCL